MVEDWKLGRQEIDDGVLIFLSRDDRKARIEVGYGLEPSLTDARCKRIISTLMVPRFQGGDFDGGVTAAVEAIDAVVRGREDLIPPALLADDSGNELADASLVEKLLFLGIFSMVIGTFSLISVASSGCTGWFLYLFLMPFYLAFPAAALGPRAGAVALGAWVIGFPLLRWWFGSTAAGRAAKSWLPSSIGRSSGGWSSGGGGGFSGGGGSFGGGGASGSW